MCYYIEIKKTSLSVFEKYLKKQDRIRPEQLKLDIYVASGFSHPEFSVITANSVEPIQQMYWGLIPAWVKSEAQAKEMQDFTLNAKSETVFEKPSFRSIGTKRCLLPATGFFEWRTVGKNKYPYYIHLKNDSPFCFGCLYDEWVNTDTGEIIKGFSVLTQAANPLMAKIHNTKYRMPFIVPPAKMDSWIDPEISKEQIQDLFKPLDEVHMEAYTISKRITSRKDNPNVPEVSEPFEYPELALLDE
jgi:putative SOS response-associated peptidase YedK